MAITCPFCGGDAELEWSVGPGGERRTSTCCGVPYEFIELYDQIKALPQWLQDIAIETRKTEYAEMEVREAKIERESKESRKRTDRMFGHLFKKPLTGAEWHKTRGD